ncbi:helix-turn-helix domain-containing protein [Nonomuraea basaltis]|uniref:helix-turn-helix domain-containing protein n=1 Tax=Nonomuraea basaltis TaxID=2495887 RepID=UPI001486D60B|nr:helix-turn-helix domain-containing protein [Nonomuraea basaltis]
MHRICVQLHIAGWIHAIAHLDIKTRLALLLLSLLYRYGERKSEEKGTVLALPLSQADMAGWIGVSTASVARILQEWKALGHVHIAHSTIIIVDVKKLIGLAAADDPSKAVPSWGSHTLDELLS